MLETTKIGEPNENIKQIKNWEIGSDSRGGPSGILFVDRVRFSSDRAGTVGPGNDG
jgi:hypothetical protein